MLWLALFSGVGILTGFLMMIGTTVYLNRSTRRFRIFELGYSKNCEWYKTGKVDFFTANYVMSHLVAASLRMRGGRDSEKARAHGSPLAPHLHIDGNHKKFTDEFPGFIKWEIIKFSIILLSILLALIGMGLDKGWW